MLFYGFRHNTILCKDFIIESGQMGLREEIPFQVSQGPTVEKELPFFPPRKIVIIRWKERPNYYQLVNIASRGCKTSRGRRIYRILLPSRGSRLISFARCTFATVYKAAFVPRERIAGHRFDVGRRKANLQLPSSMRFQHRQRACDL